MIEDMRDDETKDYVKGECVACYSPKIWSHGDCETLRPNGEPMQLLECGCGQLWKE